MAKFRHFGQSLQVFGKFWTVYFLFGKMLSLFWQIWYIIGLIFMVARLWPTIEKISNHFVTLLRPVPHISCYSLVSDRKMFLSSFAKNNNFFCVEMKQTFSFVIFNLAPYYLATMKVSPTFSIAIKCYCLFSVVGQKQFLEKRKYVMLK